MAPSGDETVISRAVWTRSMSVAEAGCDWRVPTMSERAGFSESIQMAGSSESFKTAAVTTTGRSVSVGAESDVVLVAARGASPERQALNRRTKTA